ARSDLCRGEIGRRGDELLLLTESPPAAQPRDSGIASVPLRIHTYRIPPTLIRTLLDRKPQMAALRPAQLTWRERIGRVQTLPVTSSRSKRTQSAFLSNADQYQSRSR